ncbi:RnfABCDGE type electron transport complex subunit D [uncultured Ruthenibacterium sp.]|uniref:RnfABCDGE type electron transport complex subunit D n=1 Tax=uncultured Ruthenibacterium sp. TaxID=1905347 RepID=UPI00349E860A
MEPKKLVVTASPHIVDQSSTRGLMGHVIVALLPALVASVFIFGARALLVTGVTVAACVGFEALYCILMKKPIPVGDLSAVVTGIILAFNLPATIPLWIAVVGAFIAIVVVKQLFGGIGCNFANPALVARIALFVGFAGRMTSYAFPQTDIDALATATPLVAGKSISSMDMLFNLALGIHGGVLGETCSVMLLLGGIYLIATRTISPAIPVSYLGTVAVLSLVFGQDVLLQLLGGGLLLGAFFMATDYVTSPFTLKGKIVYGLGLGIITCAIRFWGNMAEGVSFSLLIMNLLVPYINDLTRQKPLGGVKSK